MADPKEQDADEVLLRGVVARRPEALRELFQQYAPAALAVARRITCDAVLAEDVVQEAFLAVWENPQAYDRARGSVRAFVFTVVHHRAVDRVRREAAQRRRSDVESALAVPPVAVEESVVDAVSLQQQRKQVRAALEEIPGEQRRIIEMMYFDGLTQRQVAERLAVPLGTVKSRTLLGMRKLRVAMETGQERDQ